jgi:hypothetical protein
MSKYFKGKVYFMEVKFQCQILWGIKCHFLNIWVKSANGWIIQEGKVCFSHKFFYVNRSKHLILILKCLSTSLPTHLLSENDPLHFKSSQFPPFSTFWSMHYRIIKTFEQYTTIQNVLNRINWEDLKWRGSFSFTAKGHNS